MTTMVAGIVLAAGGGVRFGGAKQFAELGRASLLDRALATLAPHCRPLVLALPRGITWQGPDDVRIVEGGRSRIESLVHALRLVPPECELVVIQDCVRPLIDPQTIPRVIDAVRAGADAALPCYTPSDVVKRRLQDGRLEHLGREELAIAQSPNACRVAMLKRALERARAQPGVFVEETHAIEAEGGRVVGVRGDPWAHHIVDARDLELTGRLLDVMSRS